MGEKTNKQLMIVSSLTIISTFLMGLIDAYTFINQDGSFASAQTGNLVTLSVKLAQGKFDSLTSHIFVFVGYALGAFIGEAILDKLKHTALYKSRSILLGQVILLGLLASLQTILHDAMMIFSLGVLAGYEITVYRKFKKTTVNNGVMTGNTKNMMNNLYHVIFNHNKQARHDLLAFFLVICTFMIGAGTGVLLMSMSKLLLLWIAFLIVLSCFVLTFVERN